jgi:beta-phosphoglucomutase family hydrolase
VTPDRFDAVLFDLDGVITDTAQIHTRCWKEMFDEFLESRAPRPGERLEPFDAEHDYHQYVDGKPRYDGVRDFLRSRGIDLPEGDPDSSVSEESVRALGDRKNRMVNEAIEAGEARAYPGSVAWLRALRAAGMRTALVSSSANARAVLEAVGLVDCFDTRMDGKVAEERGLPGKPAPDTFLAAARALGATPERAVVVEDAISGVQAGRAGGFGLVLGVARQGNERALEENGADRVVQDLEEMLG